jgi:hypothetical protein
MVWMGGPEADRNQFLNVVEQVSDAQLMKKGVFYRIVNAVYQNSIDFYNKV